MDPDEWADRMTALDIAEEGRGDAWDRSERTWDGDIDFYFISNIYSVS